VEELWEQRKTEESKENGRIELDAQKSALKKRTALAVNGKTTAPSEILIFN
jgi:hypothetical protein